MEFIASKNLESKGKCFTVMESNIDFHQMAYSKLYNKQGSDREYIQTAKLIKSGLSVTQIADVLEKDPRTIESWVEGIADKSKKFQNFICLVIGITIEFLQMDELWSYLPKKTTTLVICCTGIPE